MCREAVAPDCSHFFLVVLRSMCVCSLWSSTARGMFCAHARHSRLCTHLAMPTVLCCFSVRLVCLRYVATISHSRSPIEVLRPTNALSLFHDISDNSCNPDHVSLLSLGAAGFHHDQWWAYNVDGVGLPASAEGGALRLVPECRSFVFLKANSLHLHEVASMAVLRDQNAHIFFFCGALPF